MRASVTSCRLVGLRVLVVEDDYFLALELSTALRGAGAEVIGPARDLESGLALVRSERIDCAVLDINLQGRMGFQIATELRARNVPAIFATGYNRSVVPPELADLRHLEKPVDLAALCRAVESAVLEAVPRRNQPTVADR